MRAEERSSKLYPFYGGCIIIKAAGVKKQLRRLWHGWEAFRPGKGKIKVKGRNAEWIKTDIQSIAI